MFKILNLALVAAAAISTVSAVKEVKPSSIDGSSYANVEEMQAEHIHLYLNVDFPNKQFIGAVQHTVNCVKSTDQVVFDLVGIDVVNVTAKMPGSKVFNAVTYTVLNTLNVKLGDALDITLDRGKSI